MIQNNPVNSMVLCFLLIRNINWETKITYDNSWYLWKKSAQNFQKYFTLLYLYRSYLDKNILKVETRIYFYSKDRINVFKFKDNEVHLYAQDK